MREASEEIGSGRHPEARAFITPQKSEPSNLLGVLLEPGDEVVAVLLLLQPSETVSRQIHSIVSQVNSFKREREIDLIASS